MMENIEETIRNLAVSIGKYGKKDAFTFAAYEGLQCLKEMQARIAELEKDAARLDWLEASQHGHGFCHTEFGQYSHYAYQGAVRQTIDTAMQNKP